MGNETSHSTFSFLSQFSVLISQFYPMSIVCPCLKVTNAFFTAEVRPCTNRVRRFLPDPADEHTIGYHSVTSIFEDSAGRLWVGTSGGGINRIDRLADGGFRFTGRDAWGVPTT